MTKEERLVAIVQRGLEEGENEYFDFKRDWHDNIGELVKDIICFTNSTHNEDCYILVGIDDDGHIVGVDPYNRRKEHDIVDALSELNFAGDGVPKIAVDTIDLQGKEIDILTIFNISKTPVYLNRDYKKIKKDHIYTRVSSRNTSINGFASFEDREYLWKKRFNLTQKPIDIIYELIGDKDQWEYIPEKRMYYHSIRTEYRIFIEDEGVGFVDVIDTFFSHTVQDFPPEVRLVYLEQNDTELDRVYCVLLDQGLFYAPVPKSEIHVLTHLNLTYSYYYYLRNTMAYRLLEFFHEPMDGRMMEIKNRLLRVIPVFRNEEEKERFDAYLADNVQRLHEEMDKIHEFDHLKDIQKKENLPPYKRLNCGMAANLLLKEYRRANQ